jgi:phosphatidylglycerophosphate synthase
MTSTFEDLPPSAPLRARRELRTRTRGWPHALARALASAGVRPNMVSVASLVFAALAAWAFYRAGRYPMRSGDLFLFMGDRVRRWRTHTAWWLVLGAVGIQLRLLCNLLDGLLAIEGGLRSKTGELFNEIPDRLADAVILAGAGYALGRYGWGPALGWSAAVLAVLTAYIRVLGGSLGFAQDFSGPMAKQHRMFVLTIGALVAAMEIAIRGRLTALAIALSIIVVGSALTAALRISRIARQLGER